MLTVMLNVVQFAWWTVKRDKRKKSHCARFSSVYILLVSTVLVCIQPFSMLVISSWKIDNWFFDGGDYRDSCTVGSDCHSGACISGTFTCPRDNVTGAYTGQCSLLACGEPGVTTPCGCGLDSGALVPNTSLGWIIQVFGTYLGFLLLFVGVFSATKLHVKLLAKWRELRNPGSLNDEEQPPPLYNAPLAQQVAAPAEEEEDCQD